MQKYTYYILLFFSIKLFCHDYNLVIIIDNLYQETVKTEEINMTHQCITALQQRASAVLVSSSLWKNIIDRKKSFEKKMQDTTSLAKDIFSLYQTTNDELKNSRYNLNLVNQKLSHLWFFDKYPRLAALSQDDFNQLRFDFLCYTFIFNLNEWRIYNAHTGMILFVPRELEYECNSSFEVAFDEDILKHLDKKSQILLSLEKLLNNKKNRWVVYCAGHGHPKMSKQDANIIGLKINEFKALLHYFHTSMDIKLLVYSSCYGGGIHAIEPYADLQLNYPVIVTSLTDAPIFGFGLFEGVKLPPYDDSFKLEPIDVTKNKGLMPYALQNYSAFFKRAWKGYFDLYLISYVSKFFSCNLLQCHVQKIENFPLIRKKGDLIFRPIKDGLMTKLVQQVTMNDAIISSNKPLLLYTKKIKKITIDRALPIISMLPGMVSHEIMEFLAPEVSLSLLLSEGFLSLQDMQGYKNFMIKQLTCFNDIIEEKKLEKLLDVVIIGQENLMPKFLNTVPEALIYMRSHDVFYVYTWKDQKIADSMILNSDQIEIMSKIIMFIQKCVDYKDNVLPLDNLTFTAYIENKHYQHDIAQDCVKAKICKKI